MLGASATPARCSVKAPLQGAARLRWAPSQHFFSTSLQSYASPKAAVRTRTSDDASLSVQSDASSASRRAALQLLAVPAFTAACGMLGCAAPAHAGESIEVLSDKAGFGTKVASKGSLVLVHYVGKLEDGTVFDSTRGGLKYRDGGPGVLRPAALQLGAGPVPGICAGLNQALDGMRIGGVRTVRVPASLGFGDRGALAPYAYVPAGATIIYEVELLRLSTKGPDALTQGIARCGTGGGGETAEKCAEISYLEV